MEFKHDLNFELGFFVYKIMGKQKKQIKKEDGLFAEILANLLLKTVMEDNKGKTHKTPILKG